MDSHREVPEIEVIDAFVDGERVDAGALKRALADPAGRDYFVDAWMLREAVQHDPERATVDRRLSAAPPRHTVRQWMVAAALVVGVAGGYFAGYRPSPSAAPSGVPAPITAAIDPPRAVFPAPQPTRVIPVEFQPDSNRGGGD